MKLNRDAVKDSLKSRLPKEGVHFVEIRSAVERHSSKGDAALVVELVDVDTGEDVATHWMMTEGPGAKFGMQSIKGIGIRDDVVEFDPRDLVGRRVYVAIEHGEYRDEPTAGVASFAKGSTGGYWHENDAPDSYSAPSATAVDDATPF